MRFQLFSIAVLQAAQYSQAVFLENEPVMLKIEPSFEESYAQVNSQLENENTNLVEALSKVISSLNSNPPANAPGGTPQQADTKKDDEKKEEKKEEKKPAAPVKKSGDAGTNIAITTATDQHINIFVPEDPSGKVTVKKTEGVKIVESDSDKADKNADVKKAIGDKIKAKLVHKAIKDDSDDSSDSSDGHHKKIKAQQRKIKEAKAQSAKQKKALENASKKHKKLAQTKAEAMTEDEILALVNRTEADDLSQIEAKGSSESGSESGSGSESSSGSSSGSGSESESSGSSESEGGSGNEAAQVYASDDGPAIGLNEEEIMALAQVDSPNAAVKLTPQVHVQVTRVGHNPN